MPVGEVVVTTLVPLAPERAFASFTDDIDRWWQRTPPQGRDSVIRFERDRLVAVSDAGADVLATVTDWSPPRRLDLDWRGPHAQDGDTVVIEFEPEGDGTRVTIRHRRPGIDPAATVSAIIGLFWGDLLGRLLGGQRA